MPKSEKDESDHYFKRGQSDALNAMASRARIAIEIEYRNSKTMYCSICYKEANKQKDSTFKRTCDHSEARLLTRDEMLDITRTRMPGY